MPSFGACSGCGNELWNPEDPREHRADCPNMKSLRDGVRNEKAVVMERVCRLVMQGKLRIEVPDREMLVEWLAAVEALAKYFPKVQA